MKICDLVAKSASGIPSVNSRETKIINNIDPRFEADPENEMLNGIISNIFQNLSPDNTSDPVKIWAKQFHNITVIHFKYIDSRPSSQIEEAFKEASRTAEQMGGCLYITTTKQNETTIAFTFLTTLKQRIHIPAEHLPNYYSRQRLTA